jgi:AcrR family transcriptional regulator
MVPSGTVQKYTVPLGTIEVKGSEVDNEEVRQAIIEAAFEAFSNGGYAATSTAEIAARARVSKRELYALVGNKRAMLIAGIGERAKRLHLPPDLPVVRDRKTLEQVLVSFGIQLVREISDPSVIAAFRLAIAEAPHSPEVAETLDSIGREASRTALRSIMAQAKKSGLLVGSLEDLVELFRALLLGDLLLSLLLGAARRPDASEIAKRAGDAATAFLRLRLK